MAAISKERLFFGFGIFGFLFGVGNLLSPIQIGYQCGPFWFVSLTTFILIDVFFTIICLWPFIKYPSFQEFAAPMGRIFNITYLSFIVIFLMYCVVIPRAANTLYNFAIQPYFHHFNHYLFNILYFIFCLSLSLNPLKILDIIGKIFAPILILSLGTVIFVGIYNSFSTSFYSIEAMDIRDMFVLGLVQGYNAVDALAAICIGGLIISILKSKGTNLVNRKRFLISSAISVIVIMSILYMGLAFLGATYPHSLTNKTPIEALISIITYSTGSWGIILLIVTVFCACVSISIGDLALGSYLLTTMLPSQFQDDDQKTNFQVNNKYLTIVCIAGLISFIFSIINITNFIDLINLILNAIYPTLIILVLFNFLNIRDRLRVRSTVYMSLLIPVLHLIGDLFNNEIIMDFIDSLPLIESHLAWLIPSIIAYLIASLVRKFLLKIFHNETAEKIIDDTY